MKKGYRKLTEVVEISGAGIPQLTATLVKRTDKKAIYKRWDDVWEVFRIKVASPTEIYGRTYPEREVYPGNEDFGATAWCFSSEESAMRMYDNI